MFSVARHQSRWYVMYVPTGRTVASSDTLLCASLIARRFNIALGAVAA